MRITHISWIMKYRLNIADINILAQSPFTINFMEETLPFLSNDSYLNDIILKYNPVEDSQSWEYASGNRNQTHFYTRTDTKDFCFLKTIKTHQVFARITYDLSNSSEIICDYVSGYEHHLNYSRNLYTVFGLEIILLYFKALILHSSCISWNNQGILFSASSGVGKSTQASLWNQFEGSEIINGDRTGIRKVDGKWFAYGLPIAGSSGIYRNDKVPLRAIVLLEQAKENSVSKASVSGAYRFLYPEFMIHRWNDRFESRANEVISELLSQIPVYTLRCLPDRDAVYTLKNSLLEDGVLNYDTSPS